MHEELERDEFMLQDDEDELEETTGLEEGDLEGDDDDDDLPEIPDEEKDR